MCIIIYNHHYRHAIYFSNFVWKNRDRGRRIRSGKGGEARGEMEAELGHSI